MTILVAGGSGLVGSAVVRELTRINQKVIGISSKDVNLLDRGSTFSIIKDLRPSVIIDAADRKLRKVYFPFSAFIGVYIRPFFPDLVDFFAQRKAKL